MGKDIGDRPLCRVGRRRELPGASPSTIPREAGDGCPKHFELVCHLASFAHGAVLGV